MLPAALALCSAVIATTTVLAEGDAPLTAGDVAAGIAGGGGPDVSGIVDPASGGDFTIWVDAQGRPVAPKSKSVVYLARVHCTTYRGHEVPGCACWYKLTNVATSVQVRGGMSSYDDKLFTTYSAAIAAAFKDGNGGLTGAFNTTPYSSPP